VWVFNAIEFMKKIKFPTPVPSDGATPVKSATLTVDKSAALSFVKPQYHLPELRGKNLTGLAGQAEFALKNGVRRAYR
jgi:hypothetical protein